MKAARFLSILAVLVLLPLETFAAPIPDEDQRALAERQFNATNRGGRGRGRGRGGRNRGGQGGGQQGGQQPPAPPPAQPPAQPDAGAGAGGDAGAGAGGDAGAGAGGDAGAGAGGDAGAGAGGGAGGDAGAGAGAGAGGDAGAGAGGGAGGDAGAGAGGGAGGDAGVGAGAGGDAGAGAGGDAGAGAGGDAGAGAGGDAGAGAGGGAGGDAGGGNAGGGNNGNDNNVNNGGDPQTSLTQDPAVIQDGLQQDGTGAEANPDAGVSAAPTSSNNFINFCITQGVALTDGKQVREGSCNPVPIGRVIPNNRIPVAKFVFPKNTDDTIQANQAFTVQLRINNMQTGNFVNPQTNFFAAPQQLNGDNVVLGHSHIVIQKLNALDSTDVIAATDFAFFKGLNAAANGGILEATVDAGLPEGAYRISSINTASNHQPVVISVAQHGSSDDFAYFTVQP